MTRSMRIGSGRCWCMRRRCFAAGGTGFLGKVSPVHFFWGSLRPGGDAVFGRVAPPRPGADSIQREAYSHEVISAGFWPGMAGMGRLRSTATRLQCRRDWPTQRFARRVQGGIRRWGVHLQVRRGAWTDGTGGCVDGVSGQLVRCGCGCGEVGPGALERALSAGMVAIRG